ncbi:MAG TPA: class I SAM-dependent methyltransferase [Rhodocyclaceae bacterium]|nr:class I SAM-dependent methyltransferase [Rhodocyclaceae bacterium]
MRTLLRSIYRHVPASRAIFRKISQILPRFIRDRAFLEKQVFAYLNRERNIREILFAGVEMYTLHYAGCLPEKHFQTIDIDPEKAGYGATNRHTVGSVTELRSYYKPDQFDCIILNGLIGYGLDSAEDVDQALHESLAVLRPGGLLIIGWNNTPQHLAFKLESLPGYRQFETFTPQTGNLNASRIEANPGNRHTFDFLRKPAH